MYRVEWLQSALDELATVWVQADSSQRQAITAANHWIDQQLKHDPLDQGESRPKGRRVFFAPPLGVTFRVEPSSSTVVVVHVWRFRQGKKLSFASIF